MKKDDDQYQNIKALGSVMSLGMTMAASVVLGYFIGSKLDQLLHTKVVFTIIMVILGFVAGLKSAYGLLFSKKRGD